MIPMEKMTVAQTDETTSSYEYEINKDESRGDGGNEIIEWIFRWIILWISVLSGRNNNLSKREEREP